MKVLVVDDSMVMRRLHQRALEALGWQVLLAVDGQDALEKLNSNTDLQLLVTDLHMPNVDGIELIGKVRGGGAHQKIPILMVTSDGVMEAVAKAVEAGANDVLIKPFSPAVFAEKVASVVR